MIDWSLVIWRCASTMISIFPDSKHGQMSPNVKGRDYNTSRSTPKLWADKWLEALGNWEPFSKEKISGRYLWCTPNFYLDSAERMLDRLEHRYWSEIPGLAGEGIGRDLRLEKELRGNRHKGHQPHLYWRRLISKHICESQISRQTRQMFRLIQHLPCPSRRSWHLFGSKHRHSTLKQWFRGLRKSDGRPARANPCIRRRGTVIHFATFGRRHRRTNVPCQNRRERNLS